MKFKKDDRVSLSDLGIQKYKQFNRGVIFTVLKSYYSKCKCQYVVKKNDLELFIFDEVYLNLVKVYERNSNNNVNHPNHYNKGKYEVIDVIEDWNLGFHLDNAIKYIARAPYKGKFKEDIEKAIWYLQRKIKLEESKNEK